jgi:NAD(P)H-dependent FMN reductase
VTRIGIIVGSTRQNRFSIQAAEWLLGVAQARGDAGVEYEIVDLKDVNLPLFEEAVSPAYAPVQDENGQRWGQIVDSFDGFIMATPEYNHSTSAVLKNALDYAYGQWNYKPVGFLSWGSPAGGSRAVEHLRGIVGELRMYDVREQVLLPNFYLNLDEQGRYRFSDGEAKAANGMLDEVVHWAKHMIAGREAKQLVTA